MTENKHSFQPEAQATTALHLTREALRTAEGEDALAAVARLDEEIPLAVVNLLKGRGQERI